MKSYHKAALIEVIWDGVWEFGDIGAEIERVLEDAELTPLLGNIPDLGNLVSLLKSLPDGLPNIQAPEYKPAECRSIEPVEFLYLARLLIESYDCLSEESARMTEELSKAYTDSIYSVLYQVDEDLADFWKDYKWQVLGPLLKIMEILG